MGLFNWMKRDKGENKPVDYTQAEASIEALYAEWAPKAVAYYAAQGITLTPPPLVFVNDPKSSRLGRAHEDHIEINAAAIKDAEDAYLTVLHELSHIAHHDAELQQGLDAKQIREFTNHIELRADRDVAAVIGSPLPIVTKYMKAYVANGVLDTMPALDRASLKAAAQGIADRHAKEDAEFDGITIRTGRSGYPTHVERILDLLQLDFGWDQQKATTVSNEPARDAPSSNVIDASDAKPQYEGKVKSNDRELGG